MPGYLQWKTLYLVIITWRLGLHHCYPKSEKKSQQTTENLRERWVNVLKEIEEHVNPAWLQVSIPTWNLAQILQKVCEGSQPFWVNLSPVLNEFGLTWSFSWKPCIALDKKAGEMWQLLQNFINTFFHTSILKVKVWPVKTYGSKEKKLHTNSLDETRSNI